MARESLVFFACFLALPSCTKTKPEPENKVKEERAVDSAEEALGGILTRGELCPSWPKAVPTYPGATILACQEMEPEDGGNNEFGEMLATPGKDAGPPANVSKIMTLATEASATPDEILAFYKKSLPATYELASAHVGPSAMTAFANKTNGADPVSALIFMPMQKTPDGKTSSSILLMLKKN